MANATAPAPNTHPNVDPIVTGMFFPNAEHNKLAVEAYLLSGGHGMMPNKNNGVKSKTFFCSGRKVVKDANGERNLGCGVFFRSCRQKDGDYKITAVHDEHVHCSGGQARPSAKVLKRFAAAPVWADSSMKSPKLNSPMQDFAGAQVSRRQANRVKSSVERDTEAKGYQLLGSYLSELAASSPGTITALEKQPGTEHFKRCFVMTGRAANLLVNSVPDVLSVDTTPLTGFWNGVMLTLSGKDSNDTIVVVSLLLCGTESVDNYRFLLRKSMENSDFARYLNSPRTTVYTDGRGSLDRALRAEASLAQRRLCLEYVLKSVEPPIGNAHKVDVFTASQAPTRSGFYERIDPVKKGKPESFAKLMEYPLGLWTNHAGRDDTVTCGQIISNTAEFPMRMVHAEVRNLSPFDLVRNVVELTDKKLASAARISVRSLDVYTPHADALFEKQLQESLGFYVTNLNDVFMVKKGGLTARNERVKLRFSEGEGPHVLACTCGFPARYKIPCCHALAVCRVEHLAHRGKDLIDSGYRLDLYRSLNSGKRFPVLPPVWSELEADMGILPPLKVQGPAERPGLGATSGPSSQGLSESGGTAKEPRPTKRVRPNGENDVRIKHEISTTTIVGSTSSQPRSSTQPVPSRSAYEYWMGGVVSRGPQYQSREGRPQR